MQEVLARLQDEGLQSDERFTESYFHHRVERGYGPLRIRRELLDKGVAPEIIDTRMEAAASDWFETLRQVRHRRFGSEMPRDYEEQARQSRFLYSRGFSSEQIRRLFRDHD